jgi:hypothetical protein
METTQSAFLDEDITNPETKPSKNCTFTPRCCLNVTTHKDGSLRKYIVFHYSHPIEGSCGLGKNQQRSMTNAFGFLGWIILGRLYCQLVRYKWTQFIWSTEAAGAMIIQEFIPSPSLLFDRAAASGDTHCYSSRSRQAMALRERSAA